MGLKGPAKVISDKAAKDTHLSGKQILGIGAASGITSNVVGTQANNTINSKRYQNTKGKAKGYYFRKRNGKKIKVTKASTHGVGYQQNAQAGLPGQPGQGGVF